MTVVAVEEALGSPWLVNSPRSPVRRTPAAWLGRSKYGNLLDEGWQDADCRGENSRLRGWGGGEMTYMDAVLFAGRTYRSSLA